MKAQFLGFSGMVLTAILGGITACDGPASNDAFDSTATIAQEGQGAARWGVSPEKDSLNSAKTDNQKSANIQETEVEKGFELAAQAFMERYREGDFTEFVRYMHPAVVQVYGGNLAFIEQLKKSKAQDLNTYRKWKAGPLEAFTAVRDDRGRITGWYCVVPIKRWLKEAADGEYQLQWLGGQSLNGTDFHFIDITDGDKGMIYRIMPDMRYLLENLEENEVPQS